MGNINDPFGWARPLLLDNNFDSSTIITSAATLSSNTKNKEDSINSNDNNSSPSPPPNPTLAPTATGLRLDFGNGVISHRSCFIAPSSR